MPVKRSAIYATARRIRLDSSLSVHPLPAPTPPPEPAAAAHRTPLLSTLARSWRTGGALIGGAAVLAGIIIAASILIAARRPTLTQADIDAAVLYALDNLPRPPAAAAVAYEIVQPSVVRVRRLGLDPADAAERGVGTGVIIDDAGVILTNLHVVYGAARIVVVFADGLESEAEILSVDPENDLAVLQPRTLPDDLTPAVLRTTAGLQMGDAVFAVGHPFGIGPSLSAGIISGFGRSYYSEQGERLLGNLIQFDAAANPGNSGGPLVTVDGEVVGIVTAILNPNQQSVFIGIGLAVPIETAAAAAGESPF